MNRSFVFILGATAGVFATLFFTKGKGKQIIQDIVDQYDDKVTQLSEALKDKVDAVDTSVKAGIDKVAYKVMV